MSYSICGSSLTSNRILFKYQGASCPSVGVSWQCLCESCSSANCQQCICFGKIMTRRHGCQAPEDAIWEIEGGLINCSMEVFTEIGHWGALLGKLQGFDKVHDCVRLLRLISVICRLESHLAINATRDKYKHIYSPLIGTWMCCMRYVYIDLLSCVCCFFLPRPLWHPQSS